MNEIERRPGRVEVSNPSGMNSKPDLRRNGRWVTLRERPRLVALGWTGLALRTR
jgi:hypothetical protein